MKPYLETDRLTLRYLTRQDVDNLVELDSDPEVLRHINGGRATPRETVEQRILPRMLAFYDDHPGFGYWAAIEKATGEFLGWMSLHPEEGSATDGVVLGYRLRRSAWGQGYATEAARALVQKGFRELGARRISATTYEYNVGSRRVMEKAGLRLVRRFRTSQEELMAAPTWEPESGVIWEGDDVEYALERSEWEKLQ